MESDDPLLARATAQVGQVVASSWRLDAVLGVGGMASVFAATDASGRRAAVKLLHVELALDADVRARFLREGAVANEVRHPGAVAVVDQGVTSQGVPFLVMELLVGEALATRLEREGPMSVGATCRVLDEALDVLAAAHARGIVHRDLKPDNVFITHEGRVKVLDFGIARVRESSTVAAHRTRTGSTLGTPAYMPPEQALGTKDGVDARTDLWALGATAFTMLAGRVVHEADTLNKLLLAAMTKPAVPIASVAPAIPPAVAQVVDTALAFDPARRFQDARAMQAALRAAVASLAPHEAVRVVAAAPAGVGEQATEVSRPHLGAAMSPITVAATTRDHVAAPGGGRRGLLFGGIVLGVVVTSSVLWLVNDRIFAGRVAEVAPATSIVTPGDERPEPPPAVDPASPPTEPDARPADEPHAPSARPSTSAPVPSASASPSASTSSARPAKPRTAPPRSKASKGPGNPLDAW